MASRHTLQCTEWSKRTHRTDDGIVAKRREKDWNPCRETTTKSSWHHGSRRYDPSCIAKPYAITFDHELKGENVKVNPFADVDEVGLWRARWIERDSQAIVVQLHRIVTRITGSNNGVSTTG